MPWQAVTELVRVGPFVEYHLQDRPHQQSVVPASAHHVRSLRQLIELLLGNLLGQNLLLDSELVRLCVNIVCTLPQLLVRDVGFKLTHAGDRHLCLNEGLRRLKLRHCPVVHISTSVEEILLEIVWSG